MIATLGVLTVLGILQLAFVYYVRNTLTDAASEGARFAALADNSPTRGVERTQELIRAALGVDYAEHIEANQTEDEVEVRVHASMPVIGLFGIPHSLEVRGHAVREAVP